jgi:hypothetical protein
MVAFLSVLKRDRTGGTDRPEGQPEGGKRDQSIRPPAVRPVPRSLAKLLRQGSGSSVAGPVAVTLLLPHSSMVLVFLCELGLPCSRQRERTEFATLSCNVPESTTRDWIRDR